MDVWRAERADEIKAYKKEYGRTHSVEIRQFMVAYRKENAIRIAAQKKVWSSENIEKASAAGRANKIKNKEKARIQSIEWRNKNRTRWNITQAARYAQRKGATGKYTADQIIDLYKKQRGCCAVCRQDLPPSYHKDHIIPISSGGTSWIANIQLLCPSCNCSKHAKDPIVFMNQRGFLL